MTTDLQALPAFAASPEAIDRTLARLAGSPFRARQHLTPALAAYAREKGARVLAAHAEGFIHRRLADAQPANDGEQTPMRGHPVFTAQHACACCCRGCLAKWHGIPAGRALTETEIRGITRLLMAWIARELECHEPEPDAAFTLV